jgi:hypothetical protein
MSKKQHLGYFFQFSVSGCAQSANIRMAEAVPSIAGSFEE